MRIERGRARRGDSGFLGSMLKLTGEGRRKCSKRIEA